MHLFVDKAGSVSAVYTDEILDIGLGQATVTRLSHIEFNNERQVWEALHPDTADVICVGRTRQECLLKEQAWAQEVVMKANTQ